MNCASLGRPLHILQFFSAFLGSGDRKQQRDFGACSSWSSWVALLLYGKSTGKSLFLFCLVEDHKLENNFCSEEAELKSDAVCATG